MTQLFDIKSAMHGMMGGFANAIRLASPPRRSRGSGPGSTSPALGVGFEAVMPDLMDAMATLYAKTFTAQELRDALTFYRSPSGQAMMAKMPAVMREAAPLTFSLMPKIAAAAKADYCSHRTCDKTDEALFATMESRFGKPAS